MKKQIAKQLKVIKSILALSIVVLLLGFRQNQVIVDPIEQYENTKKYASATSAYQEGATEEQMKEYNVLAKKYNLMLSKKHFTTQMKDVERLNYLYGLLSDKQKEHAEPFPNFPNPPATSKVIKAESNGRNITPIRKKFSPRGKDGIQTPKVPESSSFRSPPEIREVSKPPNPSKPLDHIIDMAKKGATFYYKEKKISSEKAISIVKKNPDLSISTSTKNNNPPVVKISKTSN